MIASVFACIVHFGFSVANRLFLGGLAILLVAALGIGCGAPPSSDRANAELQSAARDEWAPLVQFLKSGVLCESRDSAGGSLAYAAGHCVLLEPTFTDSDDRLIFAANDRYEFCVKQKKGESRWELLEMNPRDASPKEWTRTREIIDSTAAKISCKSLDVALIANTTLSLIDLVTDEETTLTGRGDVIYDGVSCRAFEFYYPKFDISTPVKQKRIPIEGTIWVDPAKRWVLRGFEWSVADGSSDFVVRCRNWDFREFEGQLLPYAMDLSEGVLPHKSIATVQFNYSRSFDPARCYLRHYGLEEPISQQAGRWPLWWTLLIAGAAALIISSLFGIYLRRRGTLTGS